MNNENKNNNKNENNNKKVKSQKLSKGSKLWIVKVSTLAFFVSLLLSLFSEIIQQRSSVVFAIILLIIFMALNVLSDMLGLAITSCQIERLSREVSDKKVYDKCITLIKNSDKVSSILCDVVGDVCGILCGVSGSMISILLSKNKRAYIKSVDTFYDEDFTTHIKEEKLNKRVDYLTSSLTALPFEDETFDYVYSFFPSKKDSTAIIKEGLRVLKKDGMFVFEGFVEDVSLLEELNLQVHYDYKDVPGYLRVPSLLKDSVIIYGKKSH